MTDAQFDKLTPEQKESLKRLHEREGTLWSEFLMKLAAPTNLFPYVGVPDHFGMFIGVESDGYTHS